MYVDLRLAAFCGVIGGSRVGVSVEDGVRRTPCDLNIDTAGG